LVELMIIYFLRLPQTLAVANLALTQAASLPDKLDARIHFTVLDYVSYFVFVDER
jgi:hypothetical protein